MNILVVAPTNCNPLARAGLIICPASMLPSALPRLNNVSGDADHESGRKFTSNERKGLTDFIYETNDVATLKQISSLKFLFRRRRV
jgi:hypothetical protein